jgi:hypothetical protein
VKYSEERILFNLSLSRESVRRCQGTLTWKTGDMELNHLHSHLQQGLYILLDKTKKKRKNIHWNGSAPKKRKKMLKDFRPRSTIAFGKGYKKYGYLVEWRDLT